MLEVEDDGQGFDPVAAPAGASQGLQIMRERAAQLAATLEVDAARGYGTRIRCTVPFGEKEVANDVAGHPGPAAGAAR